MEQKRTLWIVAAVGVFLLVVLGAALILYTPAARPATTIASSRGMDKGTASNGWISLAPSAPAQDNNVENIQDEKAFDFNSEEKNDLPGAEFRTDEVNIYADKANVYSENTDLNTLGNKPVVNVSTTIDLNDSKPVISQNTETKTAVAKKTETAVNFTKKENEKSAAKTVTKVNKPVTTKQTTSVAKTNNTKKAEPVITQYWVQVTALTSRKSADAAREKLGENEITADVFTYTDNKNQLFYRVRVGPYTTKSEAEYWRSKIAKIDSFQKTSSYVTSTTVTN